MLKSKYNTFQVLKKCFSTSGIKDARRPPKEEFDRSATRTRTKTFDPFNRKWKLTPKSAEPYNIRGGHIDWTKLGFLHRGVQKPGYIDPNTNDFVFVEEMIPEIIVPSNMKKMLKPYISYDAEDLKIPVFDAKQLFEKTMKADVIKQVDKN